MLFLHIKRDFLRFAGDVILTNWPESLPPLSLDAFEHGPMFASPFPRPADFAMMEKDLTLAASGVGRSAPPAWGGLGVAGRTRRKIQEIASSSRNKLAGT